VYAKSVAVRRAETELSRFAEGFSDEVFIQRLVGLIDDKRSVFQRSFRLEIRIGRAQRVCRRVNPCRAKSICFGYLRPVTIRDIDRYVERISTSLNRWGIPKPGNF
jgi:hypothetical protein